MGITVLFFLLKVSNINTQPLTQGSGFWLKFLLIELHRYPLQMCPWALTDPIKWQRIVNVRLLLLISWKVKQGMSHAPVLKESR